MKPWTTRLTSALLACAAALPSGAAPAAQRSAQGLAQQVEAVLASVTLVRDSARAAEELARLGPSALGPILEHLGASPAPDAPRLAALLGAVGKVPREQVLAHLAQLARSSVDERERGVGLDLLGRLGGRAEMRLALELGASGDPGLPPGPALRATLERNLLGMCTREQGAARALAGFFARAAPAAQATIARVLAARRDEGATSLLAGLLGSASAAADAVLLLELGGAARRAESIVDLVVLERVRGYLGHPDSHLVVLACSAVGQLRDQGAVPDLIVLLEDENANVRRAAHASLGSLTGLSLSAEAGGWIAWLDEALAWWDERAEGCRVALVSGSAQEAALAIHELARQRLFVHDVVRMLALALRRTEPDLVKSACRALGAVPGCAAREALAVLDSHAALAAAEDARRSLARSERRRPGVTRTHLVYSRTKSLP